MSEISKGALTSDNNSSFPNNNTGYITPTILRTFNQNMIDSLVDEISYTAESASFNARINELDPSGSQQVFDSLQIATASLNAYTASQNSFNSSATASIVALQSWSSSLDATYATDAQLTALSSSIAVTDLAQSASIAQLQSFSSSLDATYATDAQLNAATASLVLQINTKLSTASYQTDSASFDGRLDSLESWSSSLDSGYVTEGEFGAYTSSNDSKVNSLINATGSYAISSSVSTALDGKTNNTTFNSYTSSNNSRVDSLISKTGSYATTGSNIFNGNQSVTGSVSLTGTITATSASFQYVETVFETASVIYSSGSNQFGDASNDTQTLYGQVKVMNSLTASGLNYPTADGTFAGQVLQTNAAGTLSFGNVNAVFETIRNGEATTITVGTPLYVSGAQGDQPICYRANATDASKMPVTFVAMESIAAGAQGRGITLGLITGINLTGYPVGTALYTDGLGQLTSVRPTGSNDIIQPIGIVTKTGNGGQLNVLNPGPVLMPNMQTGYTFVGDATNQPVLVSTASINVTSSSFAQSASFATTASYALNSSTNVTPFLSQSVFNSYTQSNDSKVNSLIAATGSYATLSGNNTFTGQNTFNNTTRIRNNEILYVSNISENGIGGGAAGIHIDTTNGLAITSSVSINGKTVVTGSVTASAGFSGNLTGTASYATQALTASYALNVQNIDTSSFATTGSNNFIGQQKITGSVRVDGDFFLDDDGGSTTMYMNQNFESEFKGFRSVWNEAAKSASITIAEEDVEITYNAWGSTYDNGLVVNVDSTGTSLQDWNPTYVNQTWVRVPTNNGSNPAPQFPRGLGVTGSVSTIGDVVVRGNTTLSGSLAVSQSATFNGQTIFNGENVFNTPITASAVRVNGIVTANGITSSLEGTASYATQALTASYALNAPTTDVSMFVSQSTFNSFTSSYVADSSSFNSRINSFASSSIPAGTVSSSAQIAAFGYATTGSNTFTGNQTINANLIANKVSAFNFDSLFLGSQMGGTTANGTFFGYGSNSYEFLVGAYSGAYDNELKITTNNSGILFGDFNGSSYPTWLKLNPNTGTNPAPQFTRGLGVTGSVAVTGNTTLGDATSDTTTINGSTTINGNGEATVALQVISGSVEVVGPRGNGGHFYTNLPITSSEGRINGTFIAKDLIVSGTWGGEGSGSLTVERNATISGSTKLGTDFNNDTHIISGAVSIQGSLTANGLNIINSINTLTAATSSYITTTAGLATTGSNTFTGTQTLTNGDLIIGANPTTGIYNGLMLDKSGLNYTIYNVSTSSAALNVAATDGVSFSYSTELLATATPSQFTFQDFSTGDYSYKTWLAIPQNTGGNPAPQFKRGLTATGSLTITGSAVITGSVVGNVGALSISSNTASLNLNDGNFFTLQLVSGSATHINPSNIKAGQTINIRVNTTGSATVTFPSSVKQVSGSSYTPTTTTGVDIITLVSFDSSTLYLANVKNLV